MILKTFILVFSIFYSSMSLASSNVAENRRNNYQGPHPKFIFYFIGDGMSVAHVNAAEGYKAALEGKIGAKPLSFSNFPNLGLVRTHSVDRYITDSAAAGTAMATGYKTSTGTVSMDPKGKKNLKSMATMSKERGMKVGIISTVNMNDATPSVFYSNRPNRSMRKEIAEDLVNSNFDLFAGGGLRGVENQREFIEKGGYTFIDNRSDFVRLNRRNMNRDRGYYIACPIRDKSEACRYSIDKGRNEISLSELTKKAQELLYNDNGFFIMIEGGKIDWASHVNDPGGVIHDMIAFDDAVKEAIKFYNRYPSDTLIVVTSDHDTGGFGLGSYETFYESHLDRIRHQKISIQELDIKIANYLEKTKPENIKIDDLLPVIERNFGLGNKSKGLELTEEDLQKLRKALIVTITKERDRRLYSDDSKPISSKVADLLSRKSGIGWTTFKHTGINVPVFSLGVGSELFSGVMDNTDLAKNIIKIANFNE